MENIEVLVRQLCAQKDELPWLEFKHNNYNPETIGEDISALANGAALDEKNYAYFIWGVEDKTHAIVGTEYTLQNIKKGNEELENWLRQMLSDNADFEYEVVEIEGHFVGVMKILRAMNRPVAFQKTPYVRIGSYTRKLQDIPAVQARLWARLQNTNYEEQIARENLQAKEVLQLIDYNRYFDLVEIPLPDSIEGMIHYLREDSIVVKQDNGLYSITNMGAILFAKKLSNFSSVSRKAVRVVQYEGNNRLKMLRENVDSPHIGN